MKKGDVEISDDKDGNLVSLVRLGPRPNCAIFHAIVLLHPQHSTLTMMILQVKVMIVVNHYKKIIISSVS